MYSRKTITGMTFISFLGVIAALSYNPSQPKASSTSETTNKAVEIEQKSLKPLPQIAVSSIDLGSYYSEVVGFGEVKATQELNLASEVSGKVEQLFSNFEVGTLVSKGTVLAQLDKTNYTQALASAKATLAQAQLNLLEEERQGKLALEEWQQSGIENESASDLALRLPQLALAKANVISAEADVARAQRDLNNTTIKAPFNAVIVSRDIQIGSSVQIGGNIATIYNTDKFEIRLPLSEQQWENLPNQLFMKFSETPVTISSVNGKGQWLAKIERTEKHIVQETRQRAIVLSVNDPLNYDISLYPGAFVKANIRGKLLDNVWKLPSSAYSQQGNVWYVDEAGKLDKTKVQRVFDFNEHTYVIPLDIDNHSSKQIVNRPLNHFKTGMSVKVKEGAI